MCRNAGVSSSALGQTYRCGLEQRTTPSARELAFLPTPPRRLAEHRCFLSALTRNPGQTSRRLSSSGSFRTPNVTAPPRPEKFSTVQRCQPLGRKRMGDDEEGPRSSCLEQLRTCIELKVHSTLTSSNKTNPTTRYRS